MQKKETTTSSWYIIFICSLKTESKLSACVRDTVFYHLPVLEVEQKILQKNGIFWWLCLHTSLELNTCVTLFNLLPRWLSGNMPDKKYSGMWINWLVHSFTMSIQSNWFVIIIMLENLVDALVVFCSNKSNS